MNDFDVAAGVPEKNRVKRLGQIEELLRRNNIELTEIGEVKRVSLYQSLTKNDEGEAEIHDLVAVQFSPAWENGPSWPVVDRGKPIKLPVRAAATFKARDWKVCVVLPDIQIGYYRDATGLVATHDEAAISVALEVVRTANPDMVVFVGDNLDLPEMSKYRITPAYSLTTQATIDRATLLAAQIRVAAPNADIVWLAGNHEERLPKYIIDNAVAAFGLRRGGEPEAWPVLSVPFLCRLDEFGIDYRPGYPASHVWVNERLRIIHGDVVKSNSSTATAYLDREKTSVIFGHTHRIELAERTREDHDGPKTVLAASPGCLSRIDGAVPSTKQGVDLDGRPIVRHENWQQGVAVVEYEPGDGRFSVDIVPIRNGWARWRGRDIQAKIGGSD